LAEGPGVIEGVAAAKDALYIATLEGGYGYLRRLEYGGAPSPVPPPVQGAIFRLGAETTRDGGQVSLGRWLRPTSAWNYAPDTGMANMGLSPLPRIDVSSYEAVQGFAVAADGAKVPVSIVAKKGLPRNGSHPTIIAAYGAYQDVSRPTFDARAIAF